MMKYWDGQPVRFVCCERVRGGGGEGGAGAKGSRDGDGDGDGDGDDVPWGRVFWCVVIQPVEEGSEKVVARDGDEDEDEDEDEDRDGDETEE